MSFRRFCLTILALGWASVASAQATAETAKTAADESYGWGPRQLHLDLGYAFSARSGAQSQAAMTLNSSGYAPDQLRFALGYFPAEAFGIGADVRYARFVLSGNDFAAQPMQGPANELRAAVTAVGRLAASRSGLWLQAGAGYLYGQLPGFDFANSGLQFASLGVHGPLALAAVGFTPSSYAFEASIYGRYMPLALGATGIQLDKFNQLEAGAQVAIGALPAGSMLLAAVLSYELERASGSGPDGRSLMQLDHHVALGLRATLPGAKLSPPPPPPPPTGPGKLLGRVVYAEGGQPASGIQVSVEGVEKPLTTDQEGKFVARKVGPGKLLVRVELKGYKPSETSVEVPAEAEASVNVGLERKPPGPGWLRGTVQVAVPKGQPAKPAAGIEILIGGVPAGTTAEDGTFLVEKLGPGPVSLSIKTKGFKPVDEIVAIAPEAESTIALTLLPTGTVQLATLKGQVRSTAGAPVRARLKVPEANIKSQTNPDGSFAIRVPGGRYTVVIEANGYLEQTKTVEVADGDQAIFNVDMSPRR